MRAAVTVGVSMCRGVTTHLHETHLFPRANTIRITACWRVGGRLNLCNTCITHCCQFQPLQVLWENMLIVEAPLCGNDSSVCECSRSPSSPRVEWDLKSGFCCLSPFFSPCREKSLWAPMNSIWMCAHHWPRTGCNGGENSAKEIFLEEAAQANCCSSIQPSFSALISNALHIVRTVRRERMGVCREVKRTFDLNSSALLSFSILIPSDICTKATNLAFMKNTLQPSDEWKHFCQKEGTKVHIAT